MKENRLDWRDRLNRQRPICYRRIQHTSKMMASPHLNFASASRTNLSRRLSQIGLQREWASCRLCSPFKRRFTRILSQRKLQLSIMSLLKSPRWTIRHPLALPTLIKPSRALAPRQLNPSWWSGRKSSLISLKTMWSKIRECQSFSKNRIMTQNLSASVITKK